MKPSPKFKSGSALVAVFWIMSILSMAVFTAIQLLYYEVDLTTAKVQGNRADQLAEMGLAVGANQVIRRDDPLLRQTFAGGQEGFDVTIRSEGAKFNINLLLLDRGDGSPPDKALFREMLASWGMEFEETEEIVDALVDWVDEGDLEENKGAESYTYEEMGYLNRPYNRPFYSLDEVRLVRGWDRVEALNPNWQDWFTVWSGGGLDINEADPEFIALAAEVTVAEATAIQDRVFGLDAIRDTEDDLPFSSSAEALDLLGIPDIQRAIVEPRLAVDSQIDRLESIGWSGDTRRRVTLILRNRQSNRPEVLERFEETVP